jgi:hypothetical protein
MVDRLKTGSIWHEPNEWTMAMLKNERDLAAFWKWSNGEGGIALEANVIAQDGAYLGLTYEFTGWNKYVDSMKAKQNDVF